MALRKCKMCGNAFDGQNATVAFCPHCGSKQTLPVIKDDKIALLYDKADEFRFNGEYEKAMGIYELIVSESPDDAEGYWSVFLCRYGIKYTFNSMFKTYNPSINRDNNVSVCEDSDYLQAISCATEHQKAVYTEEVNRIFMAQSAYFARARTNNNGGVSNEKPVGVNAGRHAATASGAAVNNASHPFAGTKTPAAQPQSAVNTINSNQTTENITTENMLRRIDIFLEDKQWENASQYCERLLDREPENPQVYLRKLLAETRISSKDELSELPHPVDVLDSYKKCIRFADEELRNELISANDAIKQRNEARRLEEAYSVAVKLFNDANTEKKFIDAAEAFGAVITYKDAAARREACFKGAKICSDEMKYRKASALFAKNNAKSKNEAMAIFEELGDWKDSREIVNSYKESIQNTIIEEEHAAEVKEKTLKVVGALILAGSAVSFVTAAVGAVIIALVK